MSADGFMRLAYSAITTIASLPVGLLFSLHPRGRIRLRERYGQWDLCLTDCVWLHGASMGEVRGLVPVIRKLRARFPNMPLLVTATSPTGLEVVRDMDGVEARLLPFDAPVWMGKIFQSIKPKALVISETEMWPNLIYEAGQRNIPLLLVNARISDYSFPWYRRAKFILRPLLEACSVILATSIKSQERWVALGAPATNVRVSGNSKYDDSAAEMPPEEVRAFRAAFFDNQDPVLVLGSLRPGEEKWWFPAISQVLAQGRKFNTVVAPRHQEKFDYFARALDDHGIAFRRRSSAGRGCSVVLLDTVGELGRVYSFSSLAYVGGTLLDYGGHNPLEPAVYGAGIVIGPCCRNIVDIVEQLEMARGCFRVKSVQELPEILRRLTDGDPLIVEVGRRAHEVWLKQHGAADEIVKYIAAYIHV